HADKGIRGNFLRHQANGFARRTKVTHDVMAVGQHLARCRIDQPANGADQGGFAGTVRAEQGKDLATTNIQRHVLQCLETAVIDLAEIADGDDRIHVGSRKSSGPIVESRQPLSSGEEKLPSQKPAWPEASKETRKGKSGDSQHSTTEARGTANRAGTVLSHGWRRRAHTDVFIACPGTVGCASCRTRFCAPKTQGKNITTASWFRSGFRLSPSCPSQTPPSP